MFTGIPCHYSVWGEYVVMPCHHQNDILAVNEPLMITGINPSQHRYNKDQQKEGKSIVKKRAIQNDEKKCCKSTIRSVKDEAKGKSVECSSNTVPLMINQIHLSQYKGENIKSKTTPALDTRSSKNLNYKPKTKNKMAYKRMNFFQPCDTCKQIMEHRKKLFVEFKSTLQETESVLEFESITQSTVDQSCNGKEDISTVPAQLPIVTTDTTYSNRRYNSIEKSDLVKSKEMVEELLYKRRKQLCCFMDAVEHMDFTGSPIPQDFSCSRNVNSTLISLPQVLESLAFDASDSEYPPTTLQHKGALMIRKNRRGALTDIDPLVPIPNQGNFMRILQKSMPDNKGLVSWQKLACIKLRGYQVEIIRTFIHHLGISYWRLRYLVPKAASTLSHTSWVQINSLYFNVMITPHNKTINLSIFNSVTSAEINNKEIIASKDPDMLMEELTPIPNAFSPMPTE